MNADNNRKEALEKETQVIQELSNQYTQFYQTPENQEVLEITEQLLASTLVKDEQKNAIISTKRRVFIFMYPSDGLKVKGYISFTPNSEKNPILMHLRGGNRKLGLPNPGSDIACVRNYTVIGTTYRGGISEGEDQFGGDDVRDVIHLMDYIPELEQKLHVSFKKKMLYMLGVSRGAMQMFLALARFPKFQKEVNKIVSLSGILDMRSFIEDRTDMKTMFYNFFHMNTENEESWINYRDPIPTIKKLRNDLPVLIIQSKQDLRVGLEVGHRMINELKANGNPVTYWEFDQGEHCIADRKDRMELIANWLM